MLIPKLILIALAVVVLGLALVPIAVTWIENRQARDVRDMAVYSRPSQPSRTAVVFFSRSGNTALAARHIAARVGAQLFELDAPDYKLGLVGWARAMLDARGNTARIAPRMIDLSAFDTVYLGSPIWLYSPAPPIWDFVAHNRFDGKHVVLFNTFNSQFKPEFIDGFKDNVMANGARSFEHRFILRGRMTQQISPDEMLRMIDAEWFVEAASPRSR